MKSKLVLTGLGVLAVIISACASATPLPPTLAPAVPTINQSTDTPAAVPTTSQSTVTPAAALSASAATVDVGQSTALGSFLVDSKGMTLYLYTKDSPNTSACYSSCASYWPPLLTSGAPLAGAGVNASLLGTTARTDGTTQVTYNGWPLYYYVSDKAAGDTTGENVQNVWFVITPAGVRK